MRPTVLVWRESQHVYISFYHYQETSCPYCSTPLVDATESSYIPAFELAVSCPLCGWWRGLDSPIFDPFGNIGAQVFDRHVTTPVLREFDLNSADLMLAELGSHLRRHYTDIYGLSWQRFEELVGDVYKNQGFSVVHTQLAHDGGADLLLLDNGELQAIVECKKYAENRTVGIGAVRALVGACVDWRIRRAYLVTSSSHSSVAFRKVEDFKGNGFEIDLVDGSRLLMMLSAYNMELPPLDRLTAGDRRMIVEGGFSRLERGVPSTIKVPRSAGGHFVLRRWMRRKGAFVPRGHSLVEIEVQDSTGDTSLVPLPVPADGILEDLLAAKGDNLESGDSVARMKLFLR